VPEDGWCLGDQVAPDLPLAKKRQDFGGGGAKRLGAGGGLDPAPDISHDLGVPAWAPPAVTPGLAADAAIMPERARRPCQQRKGRIFPHQDLI